MGRAFFLRDGSATTEQVWSERQGDAAYVRVAAESLSDGSWISTLWTGFDDGALPSPDGRPLIFETVVFGTGRMTLDRARYATEDEAQQGHRGMVAKWRSAPVH